MKNYAKSKSKYIGSYLIQIKKSLCTVFIFLLSHTALSQSESHFFEGEIQYHHVFIEKGSVLPHTLRDITAVTFTFYDDDMAFSLDINAGLKSELDSMKVMTGDILLLDNTFHYNVSHESQSYYLIPPTNFYERENSVRESDEHMNILGHKCQKYIVTFFDDPTTEVQGDTIMRYYWIAPEIQIQDYAAKASVLQSNTFLHPILSMGFPLRIDFLERNNLGEMETVEIYNASNIETDVVPIQIPLHYHIVDMW